ncbi:MAG: hypothetical protein Kapaf2KO_03560 [Candidatus Kapaibacteriales bacterium]
MLSKKNFNSEEANKMYATREIDYFIDQEDFAVSGYNSLNPVTVPVAYSGKAAKRQVSILLAVLSILVIASANLFAAEPLVDVPLLPQGEALEIYEDSEELFAVKLLEYYGYSKTLSAQLEMMGVLPLANIPIPTIDDLTDADARVLARYAGYAKSLENKIRSTPSDLKHEQLEQLRTAYAESLRVQDSLSAELFRLGLNANSISFYRDSMMELIRDSDSTIKAMDRMRLEDYKNYKEREENIRNLYSGSDVGPEPAIAIQVNGLTSIINNDILRSELSPGANLIINTYPVFGFAENFDLSFGYYNTNIVVDSEEPNSQTAQYSNHIYSFGINGTVPGIINLDDLVMNLRLGAAAYWGHGSAVNTGLPENKWQGQLINIELGLDSPYPSLPAELIIGYNLLIANRNLIFASPTDVVELDNPTLHILKIGLRFDLWSI